MKVVISRHKLKKIESILYAGLAAVAMVATMEGRVTNSQIQMRDKIIKQIMDLLSK